MLVQHRFHGLAVHDGVRRFTAHACVDSYSYPRNATKSNVATRACTAQPTFGNSTPETVGLPRIRITGKAESRQPLQVPDLSRTVLAPATGGKVSNWRPSAEFQIIGGRRIWSGCGADAAGSVVW